MAFLLLLLLPGQAATAEKTAGFKIIVNVQNPVSTIARERLANIFLKKVKRWGDGSAIAVVDQPSAAPVRAVFSREILGRPTLAIQVYWRQQLFSGREYPPPVRASDDEVAAHVRENAGAVGYLSADASVGDQVKVLKVVE